MLAVRRHLQTPHIPQPQHWNSSILPSTPNTLINQINTNQPLFTNVNLTSNIYSFGVDEPLFDYPTAQFNSSPSRLPMQADQSNTWFSHGQLTPTSTRAHHRESSLSSLGSAGPSSPYTANTSNPQVAGDSYHDFNDFQQNSSKPLTPVHTPLQETFLTPHYQNFYNNSNLAYQMAQESVPKQMGSGDLMPAPELISNPSRRTMAVASESSTPSSDEQKNGEILSNAFWSNKNLLFPRQGYRQMPKLDRTLTDVYGDELYNPNFQITTAPLSTPIRTTPVSPQNDVFSQRLQAANNQHLSASNIQVPLTIPSRERSPFRQGSPLAPTSNGFASQSGNARFGTASHLREQQKAANDAKALQQQLDRTSPEDTAPTTISPKDVNLVYNEDEEDAKTPLFPQQERRSPGYRQVPRISHEPSEADEIPSLSQQSFGSMATTRRESSSNYSTASNGRPPRGDSYNFATPAMPARQIPQQYPFVPQTHRQTSNLSNVSEDFPPTLTSMESSGSDFAPDSPQLLKKPAGATADTGTYTCTYHGCTLRFDSPAKLQRHKREGHRNSTTMGSGADEGGMTSAAARNSQAGPHKVSDLVFIILRWLRNC
jgi:26S proteasome regulatory subunit N4